MTHAFCLPTTINAETFLCDYWQKKPLLIRQGLPQIIGMFEPQDIIELAQDPDATRASYPHRYGTESSAMATENQSAISTRF